MSFLNVEIKARCNNPAFVRNYLLQNGAVFKGTDLQTDTYFNVANGRLKLRQGNIENNLIFYNRDDQKGPKQSNFHLAPVSKPRELENLLSEALGVKVVVEKRRKIFFLDNIIVHLDKVPGLGNFVEIEASNIFNSEIPVKVLHHQCTELMHQLNIREEDLVNSSYSDMLFTNNA